MSSLRWWCCSIGLKESMLIDQSDLETYYDVSKNGSNSVSEADVTQGNVRDELPGFDDGSIPAGMENNRNVLEDTNLDLYNVKCPAGETAKINGNFQIEDTEKESCNTERPECLLSPQIACWDAELNSQVGGMERSIHSTKRRSSHQGAPLVSKARKSRGKHHTKAHSKVGMKPVQTAEQTAESPVCLFHPSILRFTENLASVKVRFSVESNDYRFRDKPEKADDVSQRRESDHSFTEGKAMKFAKETNGQPAFLDEENARFDLSLSHPNCSSRNSRDETGMLAEDPQTGFSSTVKVTEGSDFATECFDVKGNDIVSFIGTQDNGYESDILGVVEEVASKHTQHVGVGEGEFEMNNILEQNEREVKERTTQQSGGEKVLEETVGRSREAYKLPEEEQQRHISFRCANLVVMAVKFQLKILFQVLGALVLLCQRFYRFVSSPGNEILHAKGVIEKKTQEFVRFTDSGLGVRERFSNMQPMLTTGGKRLGCAYLIVAAVIATLLVLFSTAFFFSFFAVKSYIREPFQIKEVLHFDYTEPHPVASLDLLPSNSNSKVSSGSKGMTFPISKFDVTVLLTLPESDYNRQLGIFQVTAELLSTTGVVLVNTSQPCMLRYKSTTLQLAELAVMAIPLLTGFYSEAQTLELQLLKWQEDKNSPSATVRVFLVPRAGCASSKGLPELYEAKIHVKSELPRMMSAVGRWPLTLFVWTGLSFFVGGVFVMLCLCRQLLLRNIGSGLTESVQALGLHEKGSPNSKQNQQDSSTWTCTDECSKVPPSVMVKG